MNTLKIYIQDKSQSKFSLTPMNGNSLLLNDAPIAMYSKKEQYITENEDSAEDDIFYDAVEITNSPSSNSRQAEESPNKKMNSMVIARSSPNKVKTCLIVESK